MANAHWLVATVPLARPVVPTPIPVTPVQGRKKLAIPIAAPATLSPKATSSCTGSLRAGATSVATGAGLVLGEEMGMAPTERLGLEPGRRVPRMDELDG